MHEYNYWLVTTRHMIATALLLPSTFTKHLGIQHRTTICHSSCCRHWKPGETISIMTLCINNSHWSGQYSYLGTTQTLGKCPDPSYPCEGSGLSIVLTTDTYLFVFLPHRAGIASAYVSKQESLECLHSQLNYTYMLVSCFILLTLVSLSRLE